MKRSIFPLLVFFLLPLAAYSTHLRGGQIRVIPKSNPLVCTIELIAYVNTGSDIRFGQGILDFGDGTSIETPQMQSEERPDIYQGVGYVKFTVEHVFDQLGPYFITYTEPNLTGGILNMFNSVETRYSIETFIILTEDGAFASPEFPAEPIFVCASGIDYSFSAAPIDNSPDVYYLYSLLTNPKEAKEYEIPENLKINRHNGTITWDTKYHNMDVQGMIWIVVKIDKFRSNGEYLGYLERAMQVISDETGVKMNLGSSVSDPNSKIVVARDKQQTVKVLMNVDNTSTIEVGNKYEMFVSDKIKDNVTLNEYDSGLYHVGKVTFNTTSDIISDVPYTVLVRGTTFDKNGTHAVLSTKDVAFLYMTQDLPLPGGPTTDVVTAVEEYPVTELQKKPNVYPNPFRSELYVDGTEATFINSLGQVVMNSRLQKGEAINTSTLPAGFYVLRVMGEDRAMRSVKVVRN